MFLSYNPALYGSVERKQRNGIKTVTFSVERMRRRGPRTSVRSDLLSLKRDAYLYICIQIIIAASVEETRRRRRDAF